jgi:hypothetical protein
MTAVGSILAGIHANLVDITIDGIQSRRHAWTGP